MSADIEEFKRLAKEHIAYLDHRIAAHLELPIWFDRLSREEQREWFNRRHLEVEPLRREREAIVKRLCDITALEQPAPIVLKAI